MKEFACVILCLLIVGCLMPAATKAVAKASPRPAPALLATPAPPP